MVAGLTDHVWTFRELLTAQCEPLDSKVLADEHLCIHIGNNPFGTCSRARQCRGSPNPGSTSSDQGDFAFDASWHV